MSALLSLGHAQVHGALLRLTWVWRTREKQQCWPRETPSVTADRLGHVYFVNRAASRSVLHSCALWQVKVSDCFHVLEEFPLSDTRGLFAVLLSSPERGDGDLKAPRSSQDESVRIQEAAVGGQPGPSWVVGAVWEARRPQAVASRSS